jgi:hypothetical protein
MTLALRCLSASSPPWGKHLNLRFSQCSHDQNPPLFSRRLAVSSEDQVLAAAHFRRAITNYDAKVMPDLHFAITDEHSIWRD